jgi:hypothetical protein
VYGVDDPSAFIHEHDRFAAAQGLFDLDACGAFSVHGAIAASTKGGGWLHFTGTVTNAPAHVVVVMELYDLDLVPGNSSIRIDNVAVTPAGP